MDYEAILTEAHNAAREAVAAEVARRPEDERDCDCGFAWVTVEGNEAIARHCRKARKHAEGYNATGDVLSRLGDKGYPKGWQWWKPGNFRGQSVRIHEVGARAFRDVLAKHGIRADSGSRLD